uniref:Coiled-coil domain-containing protein 69-like protein n=1 Tax=Callorhinchus milii TaxID=7868 RepID=V9KIQ7_CALMI
MGCSGSRVCRCYKKQKQKGTTSKQHEEPIQELVTLQGDDVSVGASNQLEKAKATFLQGHEKELQIIREEHDRELTQLKENLSASHAAEKQQLQLRHTEEVKGLRQELQEKKESNAKIEELETRHSEYVQALRGDCETTLIELIKSHKQEKKSLAESLENRCSSLQETIEELTAQINSFQEKTKKIEDAILRRDLRQDNQDMRPPSLFWEQELESLRFVVEMKNERIHKLDKKLLRMENLAELNASLEEKIKSLQQECEDMQVRLKNQVVYARQLSVEHVALQQTLEKESVAKQRVCQKNEELLWKLENGEVSPTAGSMWKPQPESLEISSR